jgi:hypothetical protein
MTMKSISDLVVLSSFGTGDFVSGAMSLDRVSMPGRAPDRRKHHEIKFLRAASDRRQFGQSVVAPFDQWRRMQCHRRHPQFCDRFDRKYTVAQIREIRCVGAGACTDLQHAARGGRQRMHDRLVAL